MSALTIDVEIQLRSDYHIGSGFGYAGIVDGTVAKDGNGQLYIPGETLKGLTRDAADGLLGMPVFESVARCDGEYEGQSETPLELCGVSPNRRGTPCVLCRIFGSPFSPGNFHFSPAYYADPYDRLTSHPEIAEAMRPLHVLPTAFNKIDRTTGRAQEDHLFSLELGTKRRPFQFTITERASNRFPTELRRKDLIFLVACLRLIRKMGGKRRRGKGACLFQISDVQNLNELAPGLTTKTLIDRLPEVLQ